MRVLVALLAVVYAVLGMLAGLEAAVASAFSCLDTGPCTYGPDAWQSDVLVALGLASFALVIFAVFIVVGLARPAAREATTQREFWCARYSSRSVRVRTPIGLPLRATTTAFRFPVSVE